MTADKRHRVTGTAQVGPVEVRLFPSRHEFIPPDNGEDIPWAVGALVRVKFTIGELTTTKRMTQKFVWRDLLGWPRMNRPTDFEIETARATVLSNLRTEICRMGFDPGELSGELIENTAGDTP